MSYGGYLYVAGGMDPDAGYSIFNHSIYLIFWYKSSNFDKHCMDPDAGKVLSSVERYDAERERYLSIRPHTTHTHTHTHTDAERERYLSIRQHTPHTHTHTASSGMMRREREVLFNVLNILNLLNLLNLPFILLALLVQKYKY